MARLASVNDFLSFDRSEVKLNSLAKRILSMLHRSKNKSSFLFRHWSVKSFSMRSLNNLPKTKNEIDKVDFKKSKPKS